jgi:ketosteroid isomerase-like protein
MNAETALAELLDKEAIREIVYTYSRAIDRRDPDLLRSIYHPDAIDDHGRFVGTADDFANYAMGRMDAEFECTYHTMGSIIIELHGDEADVETYMFGVHISRGESEPQTIDVLACRLIDRMERRNGEWRIARRTVVRDWRNRNPLNDPAGADEFKRGRTGRDDPGYALRAMSGAAVPSA